MGPATVGFDPGEEEIVFRAKIFAPLFRFV